MNLEQIKAWIQTELFVIRHNMKPTSYTPNGMEDYIQARLEVLEELNALLEDLNE